LLLGLALGAARAGVVLEATRLIYPERNKEVTLRITNVGDIPSLVEVWLDKGDAQAPAGTTEVPFVLTPPLFRLDAKKGQSLRVIYSREPLPDDVESLFWLNVLEIPPKADPAQSGANQLRMAYRTRIKVFFRPKALAEDARDAPSKVRWSIVRAGEGYALKASNPTPYHVTFGSVSLETPSGRVASPAGAMVVPRGTATFQLPGLHERPMGAVQVSFTSINDQGADAPGAASPSPADQ
jgi:chaperone protein EcpD